MTPRRSAGSHTVFLFSVLLAVTIIIFYSSFLNAWFLGDDTQWMWFSAISPLGKIFFDSGTYLYINDANFTPMLGLSFKIDWILCNLNPLGYNIHTFFSLFAASIMLFFLLRLFTGQILAFLGSLLFILNPATVAVIGCFSNRHYLEGMFWALLSLYLFFRKENYGNNILTFFSCAAYLLASLSKEVYLILPAVIFLFAHGKFWDRIQKTLPYLILFLSYLPWRWFMLGGSMGGYYFIDWSLDSLLSNAKMAVVLPVMYNYGKYWPVVPISIALVFFMLISKGGRIGTVAKSLAVYLLALSPVIPVMAIFLPSGPAGGRYAFHITASLIIYGILTYDFVKDVRISRIVLTVIFFCTLVAFYQQSIHVRNAFVADRQTSKEETVKFLSGQEYMRGIYPPWFYDGLKKLYGGFLGVRIATRIFYEDALKYHDSNLIREVKGEEATRYLEAQRFMKTGPIAVDINWNGRTVTWKLGPADVRFFDIVLRKEKELYFLYPPVKAKGIHIFAKGFVDNEDVFIRILYKRPDGFEVVSPEIKMHIPGRGYYTYIAG